MSFTPIIILLLFLGTVFIVRDLVRLSVACPKQKVIYRFVPRTFNEEIESPVSVTDIFKTMFSQPSPWIRSIRDYDQRKTEEINKYFITQI